MLKVTLESSGRDNHLDHHIAIPAKPPGKGNPWGTPKQYLKAGGARRYGWNEGALLGEIHWFEFTPHREFAYPMSRKTAVRWAGWVRKELGEICRTEPPVTIVLTFSDKRPTEEEECSKQKQ